MKKKSNLIPLIMSIIIMVFFLYLNFNVWLIFSLAYELTGEQITEFLILYIFMIIMFVVNAITLIMDIVLSILQIKPYTKPIHILTIITLSFNIVSVIGMSSLFFMNMKDLSAYLIIFLISLVVLCASIVLMILNLIKNKELVKVAVPSTDAKVVNENKETNENLNNEKVNDIPQEDLEKKEYKGDAPESPDPFISSDSDE